MSITVSGFDYPGDKNYYIRYCLFLLPAMSLTIVETIIMGILDFVHINILNFFFFIAIDYPSLRTGPFFVNMIFLFAILRYLINVYFFSAIFIKDNIYKKTDAVFVKKYFKYYLITLVIGDLLLNFILFIFFIVLFIPFMYAFLYFAAYIIFLFVVIFLSVLLISYTNSLGFNLNLFQQGLLYFSFLVLYTLIYLFVVYKINKKKKVKNPAQTLHLIKSTSIPKHDSFYQNRNYLILCKGRKILVFNERDLNKPAFILKGHSNEIGSVFFINNYLVSKPKSGLEFGLWDSFNNFKFSKLNKNAVIHDKYEKLTYYNNTLYYLVKNILYANFSNFEEKTEGCLKVIEGFVTVARIDDNFIYFLLQNHDSTRSIIQVWNREKKQLLQSIEEEITNYNTYSEMVIFDRYIIIYNQKKALLFKLGEKLYKVKEFDFIDQIDSIEVSKDLLIFKTSRLFDKRNISVFNIFSKNSFNLIMEYKLDKQFSSQIIIDSNSLIIDAKKALFEYDLTSLVS